MRAFLASMAFGALALGGCAAHPDDTRAYVHGVQESADYHDGYALGCENANLSTEHAEAHRNNDKFENIPEYRLGWTAGQEKCKDVTHVQPSTPSIRTFD